MGYDMRAERRDDGEAERVAELRKAFYAACDDRGKHKHGSDEYDAAQGAVEEAMEAMEAADKSYFRLNIWGMSKCCDMMHALGMLDVAEAYPAWPKHEDFGVTDEQWNEWDWEIGDDTPQTIRDYHAAHEAVVSHTPAVVTGICSFKFSSNDGWLVTPDEIEEALKRAPNAAFAYQDVTWWFDWIAYLGYCKDRGGFRVH